MRELLRLVTVETGGKPPTVMGRLWLESSVLQGDTNQARDLANMLRSRTKLADPAIFGFLQTHGWSNGQLMIEL